MRDVQTTQTVQRKVRIRVVEEVSDLDYPQAQKAWAALEAAGLPPGRMVANALQEGHGYKVVEVNLDQPFSQKEEGLVGESASFEDSLVGYEYVKDPNSDQALVKSSQSVVLSQDLDEEAVDMTGIRRQKLTQIEQTNDLVVKDD